MSPRQPGECSVCGQAIPPTASSCPVCGGRSIFVSTEINVTGGLIPYGNMKALLSYYIAMCGVFPCLFPAGLIGLVLGLLGLGQCLLPFDDVRLLSAAGDHSVLNGIQVLLIGLAQVHCEASDIQALAAKPVGHCAAIEAARYRPAKHLDVPFLQFAPVHCFVSAIGFAARDPLIVPPW